MNPYSQATFITAIATTSLGIFFLLRYHRNKLYRVFALYSFVIAWWAVLSSLHTMVPSTRLALLLARVMHIGVILIPIFFTKFVLLMTDRSKKDKSWFHSACFIGTLFFFLLPSPFFVNRVVPDPPLRQMMRGGTLYILLVLFFYIYTCRALYLLYVNFRESQTDQRRKLGYLFWSSMLGYGGGPLSFLYVYDIPHPIILSYSAYTVPIYVLITTYAIIKHHLLDINLVFKRSLIYSILVVSITLVYFIVVWLLERTFQIVIGYRSIPVTVFALLTIAVLFQPLKDRIQRFVDFRFFKGTLESLADEKQKLQEEIRRTDQLRIAGALAASLAHEIKNPLTSIKTFTRYLAERRTEEGFIEKFQEIVEKEVTRIEELVKDLLDFSKPKVPKFEKTDVNKILDQAFNLIARDLSTKKIRVVRLHEDRRKITEI